MLKLPTTQTDLNGNLSQAINTSTRMHAHTCHTHMHTRRTHRANLCTRLHGLVLGLLPTQIDREGTSERLCLYIQWTGPNIELSYYMASHCLGVLPANTVVEYCGYPFKPNPHPSVATLQVHNPEACLHSISVYSGRCV